MESDNNRIRIELERREERRRRFLVWMNERERKGSREQMKSWLMPFPIPAQDWSVIFVTRPDLPRLTLSAAPRCNLGDLID